jgi:uroporphyrinogen decarboxylase
MRSDEKALLRVLAGEALNPPPIWLMRQAGRYLPEYRKVREKAGGFLDLCYTPELATEIDATLAPIYATVRELRRALPPETALIGFAGAPWTVATYMVAGRGTPDQGPARRLAFSDMAGFDALIACLTAATIRYLDAQAAAGAEVVMLFDSWAGALTPPLFERFAVQPVRQIVAALRDRHPSLPVIGFPRGAGALYAGFGQATGVAAIGLDAQVPLAWAREALSRTALQGNLDPMLMVVGGDAMREDARRIVREMEGHPHVFNLGHGITPDADPRHVEALVKAVRG